MNSIALILVILCYGNLVENSEIQTRILGGGFAGPREAPYHVSLKLNGYIYGCGGSIISPKTILTAGHCLLDESINRKLVVIVGTNNLDSGGEAYKARKCLTHPKFDPKYLLNDIAMVILFLPIRYNNMVQPIRLSTKSNFENGTTLVLTGWGLTAFPGDLSNELKLIQLKTFDTKDCALIHHINDEICTFNTKGEGSCFGDSGSPLVDPSTGDQVGIVSRGSYLKCGIGEPDVFTRVSSYIKWINWNKVD